MIYDCLASCLPVVEIEPSVANARSSWRGVILRVSDGRAAHRGEQGVVLVKVDPDLEGGGEAAGGGVGRGGGGGSPEVAAHTGHPGDGGRGGGGGLERGDLKIVSISHLVTLSGAEGGHPGALRANGRCLGGLDGWATHPIRGLDGGGGDVGAVADWAVAPGPPDADVIILVTQMSLGCGDGWGWSVPVKTGDGSWLIIKDLRCNHDEKKVKFIQ